MITITLFKVNRGNSSTLPTKLTDGWAYFCIDTGEFFIDYADANGDLYRKQINADEAKKLIDYDISTTITSSDKEIPTSKAVYDVIDSHSHNDKYYTEMEVDDLLFQKTQVQIITWGVDD